MVYANNPQSVINGFYSASRNVFLTVSVGIAMYGFSNTFKVNISQHNIKNISLMILFFALMLGINNVIIFFRYLKKLEKDKDNLPIYVDLKYLWYHIYIKIFFIILIMIVLLSTILRIRNRLGKTTRT